jgi:hypothetical protein
MPTLTPSLGSLLLGTLILTRTAAAGQDLPFAFDGPPPPVPPAVITRDDAGRATIRAVRLASPLRLDGQLDEEIYTSVPSASDMIQIEPQAGLLATEQTEVWVTFDADHIYVSVRCWESQPERMVLNEMRRDNMAVYFNDHLDIVLDTFYDRRNAVFFTVTANGGLADGQVADERQWISDWNPVWDAHVGRFAGGWSAEVAIPFKSLSYRPGRAQIWSFNVQRENWAHNEVSTLTRMPASLGTRGVMQISLAPTLVGLDVPPGSKKLDIKPYVVSDLTSDRTVVPEVSNDVSGNIGLDVRYGLGQNVTADFTYNTDFAQVEADEQQVNLTRFSLFFPEKREFFLENQGTFAFGGAATGVLGAVGDTPILFYSRRIGLHQGGAVPLEAGGRLTGRLGRFSLGVLNVQADGEPTLGLRSTNFSVVRIKRDVLRRSSIGVIYTGRSIDDRGAGRNDAYGIDGTFPFFDNLVFNTYWARTRTGGVSADDTSYRVQMDYAGDRYGAQLERLVVGDQFNPEIGFVRRDDVRRHFGQFRFSPRPKQNEVVRKLFWTGSLAYIENGAGRLETREGKGEFAIEFHNSDRFNVLYGSTYEFLPRPFPIATGVTLPDGGYDFATVRAGFNAGQQRPVSGSVFLEAGTFYSGHKTTIGVSRGRYNVTPKLSVEPSLSVNWVDLAEGSFTTNVVGSRVTYTRTSRMFVSGLLQYNSGNNAVAANVRLRWEYRPGSELFVVYNEQRDTRDPGFPGLANRAFIVKINRLFRF